VSNGILWRVIGDVTSVISTSIFAYCIEGILDPEARDEFESKTVDGGNHGHRKEVF
jgi:hypothetical protein